MYLSDKSLKQAGLRSARRDFKVQNLDFVLSTTISCNLNIDLPCLQTLQSAFASAASRGRTPSHSSDFKHLASRWSRGPLKSAVATYLVLFVPKVAKWQGTALVRQRRVKLWCWRFCRVTSVRALDVSCSAWWSRSCALVAIAACTLAVRQTPQCAPMGFIAISVGAAPGLWIIMETRYWNWFADSFSPGRCDTYLHSMKSPSVERRHFARR